MTYFAPMTHLLIVAHAPLASALAAVAAHVDAEAAAGLGVLDVAAHWPTETTDAALARLLPPGEPVLILADVFGASPCNAALRAAVLRPLGSTQVVSGVNVAMVWKALTYQRREPLAALARRVVEGGQQSVMPLVVMA